MKFTYFHFMPFDGLDEDFSAKHHSVWVDIPPSVMDVSRMHRLYNDYLDELEFAAARGFDAIGVNEHHSTAYGTMASPNMIAAALIRRIAETDAKLLVMGDTVPLYNPPTRIAEELAMLDVISGGRLIAGFPLGSSQDANFAYSISPATMRERYREGFDLILKAWTATEVFAHNGKFSKLRYVNPWPKPLQQPHPPVWLPGSGSLETVDLAIERNLPFFLLSFFGADFATDIFDMFWQKVEDAGQELNPFRTGIVQLVMVADTDAEAKRIYEKHVQYFFQRSFNVYPGFVEAPGYKSADSLRAMLPARGSQASSRKDSFVSARTYGWDDFIEMGIVIGGSPDTVREKLEDAARRSNIGNWVTLLHIGDMPKDLAMNNIELFTDKVQPALQGLFREYEHHWWPQLIEGFTPAHVPQPYRSEGA
jgi:alkanesulfonate monooxygenase SsuD/methylene tetrahydromethanopterin reductase-like flavin-dependent oxidoreductase (luciferase family)